MGILIGRDREQQRSLKLLDDSQLTPGARRLIQLDGAIGVGKSSLLAYTLAHRSNPMFLVHGDRLSTDGPLTAHRAMIEQLLGAELETLLAEITPLLLAVRCAEALGDDPVLIAVDDAQWLDPISDAFLTQLILTPTAAPLTIVLVHRSEYEPTALIRAARQRGARHEHFTLESLSDEAISRLVDHLKPEQISEVVRVAQGNPLFARTAEAGFNRYPNASRIDEVFRLEEGSRSAVLNAAITADIAALSAPARTVLQTMAILGPGEQADLICDITSFNHDICEEAVAELAEHGLLTPNPHENLHPVVRYSAYSSASNEWKIHVHRQAAQRAGSEVLKQAEHLGRIGEQLTSAEVEVLLEAANIAIGTHPQAVQRWLSDIPKPHRSETSELFQARAEILTGQNALATQRLRKLLAEAPSAEVRIQLANALRIHGDLEEARALLTDHDHFHDPDVLREAIDVLGLLNGKVPESLVDALANLPGTENRISALIYRTMYRLSAGEVPEARKIFREVPGWILSASKPVLRTMLHVVACAVWCAYMLDEYRAGAQIADRGLKLAQRFGQADVTANLGAGLAFNCVQLAQLPEVEDAASRAIDDAQRYGPAGVEAMARAALLIAAQASADQSLLRQRYHELKSSDLPAFSWWRRAVLTTLARASALLGEPEPAPELLTAPQDAMAPLRYADAALVSAVMGQPEAAMQLLDDGVAIADEQQARGQRAMLDVTRAELLLHAGRIETSQHLFMAALEQFQRLGMALQSSRARAGLARLRRRTSERGNALKSLTKREREIARKIAAGATNQQIADRLNISRRTVEHHAANIMRKLGVPSRHAITAILHESS